MSEFVNENINFELICEHLNIKENEIANCYIFGSVKLGLQSNNSDIDLILIIYANKEDNNNNKEDNNSNNNSDSNNNNININSNNDYSNLGNIKFFENSPNYFHEFDLRSCIINNRKYDINVYNQYQFQRMLKSHFMVNVECLFSPLLFILKQDIDFLPFYYEKCYTKVII